MTFIHSSSFKEKKKNMSDATPQAGVFSGMNPARFNSGDPIVLFIIQVIKVKEKMMFIIILTLLESGHYYFVVL
jgi:hypothetical protein